MKHNVKAMRKAFEKMDTDKSALAISFFFGWEAIQRLVVGVYLAAKKNPRHPKSSEYVVKVGLWKP